MNLTEAQKYKTDVTMNVINSSNYGRFSRVTSVFA